MTGFNFFSRLFRKNDPSLKILQAAALVREARIIHAQELCTRKETLTALKELSHETSVLIAIL